MQIIVYSEPSKFIERIHPPRRLKKKEKDPNIPSFDLGLNFSSDDSPEVRIIKPSVLLSSPYIAGSSTPIVPRKKKDRSTWQKNFVRACAFELSGLGPVNEHSSAAFSKWLYKGYNRNNPRYFFLKLFFPLIMFYLLFYFIFLFTGFLLPQRWTRLSIHIVLVLFV